MTISFIFQTYFWGGSTSVLINLLNELVKHRELTLNLVVFTGGENMRDKLDPAINISTSYAECHKMLKSSDFLVSTIEQRNLYISALLAFFYRKKLVNWLHTDIPRMLDCYYSGLKRRVFDFLNRFIYRRTYKNVFVSTGAKDSASSYYGLKQDNCQVIYNYIDEEILKNKASGESLSDNFLCCVGRLSREKRVGLIIDTFDSIKEQYPDLKLYIIGDGIEMNRLKEHVKLKNLGERVVFTGFCENPYPYIKKADLVISMSEYEAFPMVFLEALALGTRVFSTELLEGTTGRTEILDSEEKGILVKSDQVNILTEKLNAYLDQIESMPGLPVLPESVKKENVVNVWLDLFSFSREKAKGNEV